MNVLIQIVGWEHTIEVEDAHCTWLKANIELMNLVHQNIVVSRRRPLSENADRLVIPYMSFSMRSRFLGKTLEY